MSILRNRHDGAEEPSEWDLLSGRSRQWSTTGVAVITPAPGVWVPLRRSDPIERRHHHHACRTTSRAPPPTEDSPMAGLQHAAGGLVATVVALHSGRHDRRSSQAAVIYQRALSVKPCGRFSIPGSSARQPWTVIALHAGNAGALAFRAKSDTTTASSKPGRITFFFWPSSQFS